MPEPVPSSPPPPEAPNRILHYVGLGVLVILIAIAFVVLL